MGKKKAKKYQKAAESIRKANYKWKNDRVHINVFIGENDQKPGLLSNIHPQDLKLPKGCKLKVYICTADGDELEYTYMAKV